jgi:eukaryotic-like serine/threonine-protein kinase
MAADRTASQDCPPDMAFVDLVEGRLAGPEAADLQRHAAQCERCHAALLALGGAEPAEMGSTLRVEPGTGDEIARGLLRESDAGGSLGKTIDRKYRLVRCLGAGGMGAVYEAEHTGTGRRVAVKLIHGRLVERSGDAESRFRREARAAGATESPHIVAILDAGKDEDTGDLYLVMEHLRGEDLQHLVDRVGPLPPAVALRVAAQALAGLAKAHEAGIVHRDVKPANLFLARGDDGVVTIKVLDFGIAKVKPDALRADHTSGLTETGGLLGSPLYMSPEQMQSSRSVDHRTDLWSLGSALYCALTGRAPFRHVEHVLELVLAVRSPEGPPPLRKLAPWVPPEVADVVRRALAVDPEQRWPSAAAMLASIRDLVPDGTTLRDEMLAGVTPEARAAVIPSRPPPAAVEAEKPPPRWRRPALIAVAVAVAVLIVRWAEEAREHGTGAAQETLAASARAPGLPATSAPSPPAASASSEPSTLPAPSVPPSASGPGLPQSHQGTPPHTAARLTLPTASAAATARPSASGASHKPGVVEDVPF